MEALSDEMERKVGMARGKGGGRGGGGGGVVCGLCGGREEWGRSG